jgi:hypothetical protein
MLFEQQQSWEPERGANAPRRPETQRDLLGSFMLVEGSPSDSCERSRTLGTSMACKRSGVRIP